MGKSVDGLIADLVRERARAEQERRAAGVLQAPVEAGLALELEALAAVLHDSGPALAGQLLSAAVADVWDSLSDRQLLAATGACRELLERERG